MKGIASRNARHLGKKGFTVIELSVVIAVIAIVGVMTVSLTTLIGRQTSRAQAANDLQVDITMLKEAYHRWVSTFDVDGGYIEIVEEAGVEKLKATADGVEYEFYYANGKIIGTLPDEKKIDVYVERITALEFEEYETSIIICNVTYDAAVLEGEAEGNTTLLKTVRYAVLQNGGAP